MDRVKTHIILFLAFCILGFSPIYAQSHKSILSKNDIIKFLPETSDGKAESFWNHAVAENKEFLKTIDIIFNKNGSSAKKAIQDIAKALGETESYYSNDALILSYIDSAKYDVLGNTSLADSIHVYYLNYEDANAFCTPQTNVYVYEGLLNTLPEDKFYVCFMGILAHEFTHGLLHHALVRQYKIAKKERQQELIAGIATGLAVYHNNYSKTRGTKSMIPDTRDVISKVHIWARKETLRYQFKYSKEMEYQADIVAFRFLDWIGVGGEVFIEALQSINDPFADSNDYSDHPSTSERISLLKFLCTQKRIRYNQ